jgi:hypothetical protein
MSTNKGIKGLTTFTAEWMKHLRPARKRDFWKRERFQSKKVDKKELE